MVYDIKRMMKSLLEKLDIKSTLNKRNIGSATSLGGTIRYRIRIYITSMDRVISLVKPHMHADFLYKLGL